MTTAESQGGASGDGTAGTRAKGAGGVLFESNLPGVPLLQRGKVRDVYDLGEHLLVVTTDRISAFDVILPSGIPGKGAVLTRLSAFWFERFFGARGIDHHLVTTDVSEMPASVQPFADQLEGRSMLVEKLAMLPVECVARGYLAGSGWIEYQESESVCGIPLPAGLVESSQLPEPVFTPATKAEKGEHDENISIERAAEIVGRERAEELRDRTLELYTSAAEYARERGIIIADTKLEFGLRGDDGPVVLGDEVLTPDSSRFWLVADYSPGRAQSAFDKQFVRDWLNTLDWNRTAPGPELPDEVVAETARLYEEIAERLTA